MKWKRLALGALGAIALWNLVNYGVPSRPVAQGTCPSVMTEDGLGASMLAGALYPWAARRDVAPLPALRAKDGDYRLTLVNEGQSTTDFIDGVDLVVVDHDESSEILATPSGRLVPVRDAVTRRLRPDGSLELERKTASAHALLVLEARSTPYAEKAFFHYLATMGRGVSPLMEYSVRTDCGTACAREVMDDELARLELPLTVTVEGGRSTSIAPVSPALARRFAIPVDLPARGTTVTVRFESIPRFWQIDSVALAPDGEEVASRIVEGPRHLEIPAAGHLDMSFASPPTTLAKRSLFIAVQGYYRVPIGGALLHPFDILSHRWGISSLRDFAARTPL